MEVFAAWAQSTRNNPLTLSSSLWRSLIESDFREWGHHSPTRIISLVPTGWLLLNSLTPIFIFVNFKQFEFPPHPSIGYSRDKTKSLSACIGVRVVHCLSTIDGCVWRHQTGDWMRPFVLDIQWFWDDEEDSISSSSVVFWLRCQAVRMDPQTRSD